MAVWMLVGAALLSSIFTLVAVYLVYRLVVKPDLDVRMAEVNLQLESLEHRVSNGVRQGINDSLRDFSERAMVSTTRSVARVGAELVEGGLGVFLGERKSRQEKGGDIP